MKQRLGHHGEAIACQYLEKQGYQIISQNYTCRLGEIDLIAQDGDTLVFVEVRSKSRTAYGLPVETVDYKKQTKLRRTAEHYLLAHHQTDAYCRFDVVSIVWQENSPQIELYKDAFW